MTKQKPRALLLAMMDMPADMEDEFATWSDDHHVAARLACPGFISYRRFVAVKGEPKYLLIYELEGPEALETPEYKSLMGKQSSEQKAQSDRLHNSWTKFTRNVYTEVASQDVPKGKVK